MHKPLAGKNVAVLVASGFEEIQMTDAQKALLAWLLRASTGEPASTGERA